MVQACVAWMRGRRAAGLSPCHEPGYRTQRRVEFWQACQSCGERIQRPPRDIPMRLSTMAIGCTGCASLYSHASRLGVEGGLILYVTSREIDDIYDDIYVVE